MSDAAHGLMLKYGLGHKPTDAEVSRWAAATDRLISQGNSSEVAGNKAAEEVFSDYKTYFYKSQADTIQALLAMARLK